MKKGILLFIMAVSSASFAQVDIDYKLKLLEENVGNAQSNFDRYKENYKISVQNFNAATKTINDLRKLKSQAVRDQKRSASNSLVFGQVMEKYTEFVAQEQSQILKEEGAITKLFALIEKIKENTEKRKALIEKYKGEVENARNEIQVWRVKKEEVAAVMDDISAREKFALEEREKWGKKKEVYKKETQKWSKENANAKRTLATFEKLRK